jgi:hypothetical protein
VFLFSLVLLQRGSFRLWVLVFMKCNWKKNPLFMFLLWISFSTNEKYVGLFECETEGSICFWVRFLVNLCIVLKVVTEHRLKVLLGLVSVKVNLCRSNVNLSLLSKTNSV